MNYSKHQILAFTGHRDKYVKALVPSVRILWQKIAMQWLPRMKKSMNQFSIFGPTCRPQMISLVGMMMSRTFNIRIICWYLVDVVGCNCPRVGVCLYVTGVVIEFALRVMVSTMVLIAMVDTNRSPHVSCETWGLFVIIGLVLGKTGELFLWVGE